jgi:osmoprotectant transport system permease protein
MRYLINHPGQVLQLTGQHVEMVGITVVVAVLVGIPLGILVARLRWLEGPVVNTAGVLYTVPSLALFAVLIPFTGIGTVPVVIALILYSLLVIIRNTIAGIDAVDPATRDAARGMGMTSTQQLVLIELPLGLPVILAGVRVATVSAIGIATVAAYVGAGGLGVLIFDGIERLDADLIVAGAVSASVLALVADWCLGRLGDALRRDTARHAGAPRRRRLAGFYPKRQA